MKRPYLPTWILLAVATFVLVGIAHARDRDRFQLVEATIAEIHDAFRSGTLAPEELVRMYLARIAAYDQSGPQLNSFMHVNEHALSAARALRGDDLDDDGRDRDEDGEVDGHRKPLFGVPVILKDKRYRRYADDGRIDRARGSIPAKDAFHRREAAPRRRHHPRQGDPHRVRQLHQLHGMPTGYSSQLRLQLFQRGGDLTRAGLWLQPVPIPDTDPRQAFNDGRPGACDRGSSSGPGIAVSAKPRNRGGRHRDVGIDPQPWNPEPRRRHQADGGLVSRTGIVPITADQDTAGPMARYRGPTPPSFSASWPGSIPGPRHRRCLTPGNCFTDYTRFLKRARFAARASPSRISAIGPQPQSASSSSVEQQRVMNDAIAVLRAEGAIVEDFHEIPTQQELFAFSGCGGLPIPANCSTVLLFGFQARSERISGQVPRVLRCARLQT